MTAAGKHPIDPRARNKIARLMQIHKDTHPDRIGRRFGVTGEYVRRLWTQLGREEQAPIDEALSALHSTLEPPAEFATGPPSA
jgi:hypothetical protein